MEEKNLPKLLVSREEAEKKIERRLEIGRWLRNDQTIDSDDELDQVRLKANNWSDYNEYLLLRMFGEGTTVKYISYRFHPLSEKDMMAIINSSMVSITDWFTYELDVFQNDMAVSISSLEGIRDQLEVFDGSQEAPQRIFGEDVFVVHGHDEAAKLTMVNFVKTFNLNPIILDEKANEGQTIIEKFEAHAGEAGYAIILLTPDDVGAAKDNANDLKPRARQNVILELGYFMGQLGRNRVCVLYRGNVELPSDIHGIAYVPMNNPAEWQLKLAKEMKQTGLPIDLNKLA